MYKYEVLRSRVAQTTNVELANPQKLLKLRMSDHKLIGYVTAFFIHVGPL